MTQSSVISVLQ